MSQPTHIHCRFKCNTLGGTTPAEVAAAPGGSHMQSVSASAVHEGEGNEDFSRFTPSGSLNLTITNPSAIGFFEADAEYDIVISRRPVATRPTKETIEAHP